MQRCWSFCGDGGRWTGADGKSSGGAGSKRAAPAGDGDKANGAAAKPAKRPRKSAPKVKEEPSSSGEEAPMQPQVPSPQIDANDKDDAMLRFLNLLGTEESDDKN